jgi:hypothetical protein
MAGAPKTRSAIASQPYCEKNDLILELRKNRGCPGDIQRRRPAGGKLLNVFNSFDPTKICLAVES